MQQAATLMSADNSIKRACNCFSRKQMKTFQLHVISSLFFVLQDICDNEERCFRQPDNCEDHDCAFIAGWEVNGDYVDFKVSGSLSNTHQYLALGFSDSGNMVSNFWKV